MAVADLKVETLLTPEEENPFVIVFRRFIRHRLAVVGMVVIILLVITAFLAPWVAPYDPYAQNTGPAYADPGPGHILGTDELGRDVFSRLLYAARLSLFITIVVNVCSETTGVIVGAISGYFGGWVDNTIQRATEFMLTLPLLPLLLFFSAILRGITIPGFPAAAFQLPIIPAPMIS